MAFPVKKALTCLIIAGGYLVCNCTIILDSGNPSRFIRGTFMDVNHPELIETSVHINQQQPEQISLDRSPGFAQVLTESIISELTAYNEAMTAAMIIEAKEISGLGALTMCQFSRTRMTSLSIINTFRALFVKLAMAEVRERSGSSTKISAIVQGEIPELEDQFAQMATDLHNFDEGKHGKLPMKFFGNAVRDFTRLSHAIIKN
ncbi:unnamed protein product [Orchesella dallaii]|uniref:Uncharacterized protein n=1 Tax=Orchesella dallaii TaxID=48710 RepID=A0ABP1QVN8_9HEXA